LAECIDNKRDAGLIHRLKIYANTNDEMMNVSARLGVDFLSNGFK
jgi:hypothetical protein